MDLFCKIPKHKILILDKKLPGQFDQFLCVYQDFQNDTYNSLQQLLPKIEKYDRLKIVFPSGSYHPKETLTGFKYFCQKYQITNEIITDMPSNRNTKRDVYITLMEGDLVNIIKQIKSENLKAGVDIGIISYKETPLKDVLLDGITVISTDFEELGRRCAYLILENNQAQIINGFHVIERVSL